MRQWEHRHIKSIDVVVPEVTELGKLVHNVYYAKNPVHCALVAIGVVAGWAQRARLIAKSNLFPLATDVDVNPVSSSHVNNPTPSSVPSWIVERRRPRVAILGAPKRPRVISAIHRLRPAIAEHADIVIEDFEFAYDFTDADLDLVIVLGGDGSILQSARQVAGRQIPVLGINCGTLGFLAALSPEAFLNVWPDVSGGEFSIVDHLMLRVAHFRGGVELVHQLALNEAAILGGPPYQIMEIDLYADEILATTYRCDGLIVSTPVGSTAYNLSAGGPIVRKHLRAIIIQPLSPHTLTYRPLVDSADTHLELVVARPNASTSIVTDGRVLGQLVRGDRVSIRAADHPFRMLNVPGQNEYRTLREKLGWGGSVI